MESVAKDERHQAAVCVKQVQCVCSSELLFWTESSRAAVKLYALLTALRSPLDRDLLPRWVTQSRTRKLVNRCDQANVTPPPPGVAALWLPRPRNRELTPDEIQTLWNELDRPPAFGFTADATTPCG